MLTNNKKNLVEKLLMLKTPHLMNDSNQDCASEYSRAMKLRLREEQIKLHLKFYNLEQLKALICFYDTDIGKSILESQLKIDRELSNNVSIISDEAHHQSIEDIQSKV